MSVPCGSVYGLDETKTCNGDPHPSYYNHMHFDQETRTYTIWTDADSKEKRDARFERIREMRYQAGMLTALGSTAKKNHVTDKGHVLIQAAANLMEYADVLESKEKK